MFTSSTLTTVNFPKKNMKKPLPKNSAKLPTKIPHHRHRLFRRLFSRRTSGRGKLREFGRGKGGFEEENEDTKRESFEVSLVWGWDEDKQKIAKIVKFENAFSWGWMRSWQAIMHRSLNQRLEKIGSNGEIISNSSGKSISKVAITATEQNGNRTVTAIVAEVIVTISTTAIRGGGGVVSNVVLLLFLQWKQKQQYEW